MFFGYFPHVLSILLVFVTLHSLIIYQEIQSYISGTPKYNEYYKNWILICLIHLLF